MRPSPPRPSDLTLGTCPERQTVAGASGALLSALLGLAACTTQTAASGEGPERSIDPGTAEPRCAEAPTGALAEFAGSPCPWVLEGGDALRLRSLAADGPELRGDAPDVCTDDRCRFEGFASPLGPLLIASVRAGEGGETPDDVWLGAALGGDALAFTPLWWGEDSRADRSHAGAVWELSPWRCGERLVLRPRGRLPEAAVTGGAPAGLIARAGAYAIVDGELRRSGDDPGGGACEALALYLP